ncbi:MAG: EAL domain-containing protein [Acidobacteriota bacterium]|nr:EAL domain-containing protein [Acidobacteriota bacterium]
MQPNNRILIVDDNTSIHRDFNKVLSNPRAAEKRKLAQIERGLFQEDDDTPDPDAAGDQPEYIVDSAYQGEEALEMVEKAHAEGKPYALIFMDVRMPPGWDGIETISRIWEKFPEIEMVICTAYSDYSWERILSQLGTTDRLLFLRKPFDTTAVKQMALSQTQKWNLAQKARHYVEKLKDEIETRKKSEAELQYLAHHDPLTGLANRTKFNLVLDATITKAGSEDGRLAMFFVDLDRFKEINDTLGYHNGDLLLKQIADRIKRVIGETGIVARFGGDEFAVMVPDVTSVESAAEIATRIHDEIEPNFQIEDLQLEVTASIGIVLYPEHGEDADTLMRRADITMSVAKKSDPGYTFYEEKYDHFSLRSLTLLGELRQAIHNNDLSLHYQPKISIETGIVTGVEALVRWHHPKHGQIYPDEFIPLAERSGLIKPLSMWVLKQAPRQWAGWNKDGIDVSIAVNLSVRDLFDVHIPEKIRGYLEEFGMPANRLVLEITESAMMEDPNQARSILMNLSNMGVRLAIDDFGTGYSSLAYLKNLPVDEIKIDKSFVLDMDKDADDAIIVKSTVDLGHTLGLSVVAEGVEAERHWQMLRELNCDYAQGYYMSRPKPAEDLAVWMGESRWGLGASKER